MKPDSGARGRGTIASARESWLSRRSFREKLYSLPTIAVVALVTIAAVMAFFSNENRGHLVEIEEQYLPTLESSRNLEELLATIQRRLQDASSASDPTSLREADELKDEFFAELSRLARARVRSADETRALRESFREYYDLARALTAQMIAGDLSTETVAELERMRGQYNEMRRSLEEATRRDRASMASAFDEAREANTSALSLAIGATVLVGLLLGFVTTSIARVSVRQLALVAQGFEDMAKGDFSKRVEVILADELGDLGRKVNDTIEYLAELVGSIRSTATKVSSAAAQLSQMANEHERGAAEQSGAVEETQRTMQSILASTDQINVVLDVVLRNAEQTQAKSQLTVDSIASLTAHADGITEILSTIKDIANKAELLALNAALEGTKAGEVGRGFSLVASQMQRLAESVMRAVGDIKVLTATMRESTSASAVATEETMKIATDTTRSAREIRLGMQQHRTGTQQVVEAMAEVAAVAEGAATGSQQLLASSRDLASLSQDLLRMATRFELHDDSAGAPP